MADLDEKHSGINMNKVLIDTLKEYNIEYNINR